LKAAETKEIVRCQLSTIKKMEEQFTVVYGFT